MNDQPSADPAVPLCTSNTQDAPNTSQTLFGEIAQLVKILDQNPDIFQFLRTLLAK